MVVISNIKCEKINDKMSNEYGVVQSSKQEPPESIGCLKTESDGAGVM